MKTNNNKFLTFTLVAGTLIVAGCATRPEREFGSPPTTVTMPPRQAESRPQPPPSRTPRTTVLDDDPIMPAVSPTRTMSPPVTVTEPPPRPAPEPREGTPYTIKRGETLSAIAARHRISWRQRADYNRISDPNSVRAGQTILIPPGATGASTPSETERAPTESTRPAPAVAGEGTYVVQAGDNLTVVARRHGTTVSALRQVNDLTGDRINVGQTLKLPAGTESRPRATPRTETTSTRETARPTPEAETIRRPDAPRPTPTPRPVNGNLRLPDDAAPRQVEDEPVADDRGFPIVVEEGDTLQSIANSFVIDVQQIRRANNLGPNDEVRPGDRLIIPPTSW
ncbi:MAG: LysM peptidoglycan-binding domain-containing protein [Kiritimatiellae bacterium]|nr:LysM peptidoglycan-binding domain-containing protein [Kiritimatiellia bacterium]